MTRTSLSLLSLACAACAGSSAPDAPSAGAAPDGARAASALLASLPDAERRLAAMPFDTSARLAWFFVPLNNRVGAPIGRMGPAQRSAVDALLRTALSDRGTTLAHAIIHHEGILKAVEDSRNIRVPIARDSTKYYASIFGTPAADSAWAWRFEGHHLSVNVTHVGRDAHVVAPLFMGANPARVPSGPAEGLRILAAEEDEGRALVRMLATERRTRAIIADTTFGDIVTRNDPKVQRLPPAGVAASEMSPAEQAQLRKLLNVYASRLAPAVAREQLDRIERAGFGTLRFAWAGSLEPTKAHYYRIHGPTVLVEYDNTQTGANHIHTVWRDLDHDFGGDLLRAHYAKHRHPH